jgi:hypothetical protein
MEAAGADAALLAEEEAVGIFREEFTTFNDIVMFPVADWNRYPNFEAFLFARNASLSVSPSFRIEAPLLLGGERVDEQRDLADLFFVVLLDPTHGEIVEEHTFDDLMRYVRDVTIWDARSHSMRYVAGVADWDARRRMMDVLRMRMSDHLHISINIREPRLRAIAQHLIDYGFGDPRLGDNGKVIVMAYFRKISPTETLERIDAFVVDKTKEEHVLKLFFPTSLAKTLAAFVSNAREVGGALSLSEYDDAGVMTLGLHSNNYIHGTHGSVQKPLQLETLIAFHSHPETHHERGDERYLNWPSGQDVSVIAAKFFYARDQIAEVIPSAEGIWLIHPTVATQRFLKGLRGDTRPGGGRECARKLIEGIRDAFRVPLLFVMIEHLERLDARAYMARVNAITLADIYYGKDDADPLLAACRELGHTTNFQLFRIGLIPWSDFHDVPGVPLSFSYIVDDAGGQPEYIEPQTGPLIGSRADVAASGGAGASPRKWWWWR